MEDAKTKIQRLRAGTGLSQSKFAAYFAITKSTMQAWEQGRRTPPPYVLIMMERILELEQQLSERKKEG